LSILTVSKASLVLHKLLVLAVGHVNRLHALHWGQGSSTRLLQSRRLHQIFNGLFSCGPHGLELVEWSIHDLTVHALEFTEFLEVNLNVLALTKEFSQKGQDIEQRLVEGTFLETCRFGHHWVFRSC
jgi:hypothetical protein